MSPSKLKKLKMISCRLSEQLEYFDQVRFEGQACPDLDDIFSRLFGVVYSLREFVSRFD